MVRYQIILAYDGTHFHGFQRQFKARTVQQTVEEALHSLGWQGRSILAAGRTDSGVHAAGQVIAFDLDWAHSEQDLLRALNSNLPQDISAQQVRQVLSDFHPRYDAVARTYRYHLICREIRQPLLERFAWRVWPELNLNWLNLASLNLIGKHDFSAFGAAHRPGGSTIREIYLAEWQRVGTSSFMFEVKGNAFLYHMVRRMVDFLVKIGTGVYAPEEVRSYLQSPVPQSLQGLAPAHGLSLWQVHYSE